MIDARLLLPAAAAWLGAIAALSWTGGAGDAVDGRHARAVALTGVAALLLIAAGAGLAIAWRRGAERALAAGLVVAFLALGAGGAAARSAAWSADPLGAWVDAGAMAVVRGVVASEPVVRQPRTGPAWSRATWIEVRLRAESIAARGAVVRSGIPLAVRLADGTRAPPPGTRVEVRGRLAPVPVGWSTAATVRAIEEPRDLAAPGAIDAAAQAMRIGLRRALVGTDPEPAALVAGLSIGDESAQPADLAEAMRASGLSHLTAVSGGNVAIVLGAVLALGAALRLGMVVRTLAALGALAFFVVLVGPQASVLRAAAMGAVGVGALLVGGRRGGPSLLATAVVVLVLVEPSLALSWAFALSAAATAGLILVAPRVLAGTARWRLTRRWPLALRQATALTLAAQAATLPLLVAMGAATGWVAVPANLAAMPAVAPVTVLGLASAITAPVVPPVAMVLAQVAAWPAAWIAAVAQTAAQLPASGLPLPPGWAGLAWLAGLACAAVVLRRAARRLPARTGGWVRASAVVVLVVVAVGAALPPDRRGWPPAGWLLIMCDVGQGDALVVNAGAGSALVVDAGPDPEAVDECLADADVVSVPLLVLTHFHADHVLGVPGVLRGRTVAQVVATPVREPIDQAAAVDAALGEQGLVAQPVTAGEHRLVGDVDLRLLWPRRRIPVESVPNNASIVAVVTVRGRRLLLTGDVEPPAQSAVAADLRGLRLDVVKVPHHGSRYQSPLLPAWAPAPVALVSVGRDNDYGHPAPETLDAWAARGAVVGRTDVDGDTAVVDVDGVLGVVRRGP